MFDIVMGYIADLIFGDPYWFPHPVRFIGRFISSFENLLRRLVHSETSEKIAGFILTGVTVVISYLVVWILLKISLSVSTLLFHIVNIFFIYTVLATRCLGDEAKKIYRYLINGDINNARKALSYIVGRDTEKLDVQGICRAVIETVSENTSDGIVAPLFYLFLGGVPLAMAYKAINTLDSMVGYKNERYINMGMASARLDDIANFIPARLTSFLIAIASFITGLNPRRSLSIMLRDGRNNPSPNSGYPEASMAGALGVRLGGPSSYGGQIVEKPYIGDPEDTVTPEHIILSTRVMYVTSLLALITGLIIQVIL
ncbi:MAG TPA: adenosylcobinamide-phosphate synthase CbiB [bacterium]|jgi:adenosylcobinamide-phosphate synthase|nr:cobalamin biosynthesis protein CobD [Dictyoglomota bacterium]HHV81306.1 cobalamin biosynthesis protein CobD [bacterium]HOK29168.1 adenosylcobinamide-phosphate synthase CbiB [bacterium]HOL54783.1 adenosylcobinamide-phosphate synthase CbiB [bacterium]HON71706.1 adenosylcobinamide-phosphate synthase CbiB [bacterium]